MFMYSCCNVSVFLLIRMSYSVYSVSLCCSVYSVCKCVMYYCHHVSTQLRSTNISYHISNISEGIQGYQQELENCLEWEERYRTSVSV